MRYYLGALAGAMGRLNSMNINQGGGMKLVDPGQVKLAIGRLKSRSSSGWKEKPSDPEAFTSDKIVEGPGGKLEFDRPYANPHSPIDHFQASEGYEGAGVPQAPPPWLKDYMRAQQGMQDENEQRAQQQVGGVPTKDSFGVDSKVASDSLHDAQVVKGMLGTIKPNIGW